MSEVEKEVGAMDPAQAKPFTQLLSRLQMLNEITNLLKTLDNNKNFHIEVDAIIKDWMHFSMKGDSKGVGNLLAGLYTMETKKGRIDLLDLVKDLM